LKIAEVSLSFFVCLKKIGIGFVLLLLNNQYMLRLFLSLRNFIWLIQNHRLF